MSLGSRSGVHWIRRNSALTASATVWAAVVFARPGNAFQQDVPAGQQPHQQRFTKPCLAHHFGIETAGNVRHHLLCPGQFRRFDSCGRTGLKQWIFPLLAAGLVTRGLPV